MIRLAVSVQKSFVEEASAAVVRLEGAVHHCLGRVGFRPARGQFEPGVLEVGDRLAECGRWRVYLAVNRIAAVACT